MLTMTAFEDSSFSFWPRVREIAVPPSMIETATARRCRRRLGGGLRRRRIRRRSRPAYSRTCPRQWPGRPAQGGPSSAGTGPVAVAHAQDRARRTAPHRDDRHARQVRRTGASPSGASRGAYRARVGGGRAADQPHGVGRPRPARTWARAARLPAPRPSVPPGPAPAPLGRGPQPRTAPAHRGGRGRALRRAGPRLGVPGTRTGAVRARPVGRRGGPASGRGGAYRWGRGRRASRRPAPAAAGRASLPRPSGRGRMGRPRCGPPGT